MLYILLLITLSLFAYQIAEFKRPNVLVQPTLSKLVFYRDYLLLTMIPYVYFLWGGRYKGHYILGQLGSDIYFFYAATSAFVFFIVFILSYRFFFPLFSGLNKRITFSFSYKKIKTLLCLGSSFVFILVVVSAYSHQTGVFALISGLDPASVAVKRSEFSQSGGFLKVNKIFMKSWVPMLSYVFVYLYFSRFVRFRLRDKVCMLLSVMSGVMASLYFLEKSVLFFYVFGLVGVYVYSGRKLKKYHMFLFVALALLSIGLMYLLTYGDRIDGLLYLRDIVLHRTMTQSVGSVMAFEYFSFFDFKGMAGVSNTWAAVSGESFSSPYSDIIDYYVPSESETSGAMSSFVTGEAYGLFGVLGVLFSGIIVAFWYSFFEATKYSKAMAIVFVGIYGLYFSHFYVASSFFGFVWPVGLAYNIIPFFLLLLLSGNYKRIRN